MKKVLFLAAALTLVASAAFAGPGIDLSVNACPGNATAVGIDGGSAADLCAGGAPITVIATFSPVEAIADFLALDSVLDAQAGGDLGVVGFWNFDVTGCNVAALSNSHTRPSTGCATPNAYTASFSLAGSGEAISAAQTGPQTERIGSTIYRPGVLAISPGQKLFGMTITIDGSTSTEGGGTCDGCGAPFCLVWNQGSPRSNGAIVPTDLFSSTGNFAGFSNLISFNGGGGLCQAVPAKKRTWGQLKSLYR